MEKKAKIIIVTLIALLLISSFINLQTYNAKLSLQREREGLKKENESLEKKIEESREANRRLESRVGSLNTDLDRVSKDREEIQRKYDLVIKEKTELLERLKAKPTVELIRPTVAAPTPPTEDTYWAQLLKIKTELELQLNNLQVELRNIKTNNEQLQREKSTLELELTALNRQNQDLERQMEYNKKITDSIAQELVRERNDRFQVQNTVKAIKNENTILRRQLKSLSNRKINLEKKLTELQVKNAGLENRLAESDIFLKDKMTQIETLKKQLEQGPTEQEKAKLKEESVELPPIVVHPQTGAVTSKALALEGRILAIDKENNFVIVDLGVDKGIKMGDTFKVYREDKPIATIEVIQTRNTIAACDIKKETKPIKIGDTIR